MAEDKGNKQAEDLEVTPDKASDVKGGLLPVEPGGTSRRGVSVHAKKHGKASAPKAPSGGMPHQ